MFHAMARIIKSIEFPKDMVTQLEKEAEHLRMKFGTYVRMLLETHPNREKGKKK